MLPRRFRCKRSAIGLQARRKVTAGTFPGSRLPWRKQREKHMELIRAVKDLGVAATALLDVASGIVQNAVCPALGGSPA